MTRALALLGLLALPCPALALDCYVAGDVVPYSRNFHDPSTGALTDPTSPAASVRITPLTGTATYGALTAPAKLNSVTGWYGGEYTVSGSPTLGTYEVRIAGTVGGVAQAATVERFQVRAACEPGSQVVETQGSYTDQEAMSVLLSILSGEMTRSGAAFTIKTPDGVATRVTGSQTGTVRNGLTLTPAAP